jgi:hypothetical protein
MDLEAWGTMNAHGWMLGNLYLGACLSKPDPATAARQIIREVRDIALKDRVPKTAGERAVMRAMDAEFDRILEHMLITLTVFSRGAGQA